MELPVEAMDLQHHSWTIGLFFMDVLPTLSSPSQLRPGDVLEDGGASQVPGLLEERNEPTNHH